MGSSESGSPTKEQATASLQPREQKLKGIPASPGIAVGRIFPLYEPAETTQRQRIREDAVAAELARFEKARQQCIEEMQHFIRKARDSFPSAVPILEAQLVILNDPLLLKEITNTIYQRYAAPTAVAMVFNTHEKKLLRLRDPLFRDRALDLEDVKDRILSILRNEQISLALPENTIIAAHSLTPSEILLVKEKQVLGIILESSSVTSHPVILARSLNIPAVVGVRNALQYAQKAQYVIIDGYSGTVIFNPTEETLARYRERLRSIKRVEQRFRKLRTVPTVTRDDHPIRLYASADSFEDLDTAIAAGAEGIGLLRTELFLPTANTNGLPTEEQLSEQYAEIAARAYPLPVTFRLFDLTADKLPHKILFLREPNPALGLRGVRLLLKHRSILGAQLRAILRASQHRNVRLLIPMVTTVEEVLKILKLLKRFSSTFQKQGIPFDAQLPIGIMVETPAAALLAPKIAPMIQFMSIGSNDLTQYTLAADRDSSTLSSYYDPFHPAVLQLMAATVEAAAAYQLDVMICGEFASHPLAIDLLIGLGISSFAVPPSLLLATKKRILESSYTAAQKLAAELLQLSSAEDVRAAITAFRRRRKQHKS